MNDESWRKEKEKKEEDWMKLRRQKWNKISGRKEEKWMVLMTERKNNRLGYRERMKIRQPNEDEKRDRKMNATEERRWKKNNEWV